MARPPGVLLLAVGYGAGLATGLSRLTDPVFAALILLTLAVLVWREWWFPIFPALCVGLVVGGHARHGAGSRCAATLPLGEQRYRIRSLDPGEGTGRVVVSGRGCDGTVLARWPRTTRAPAGVSLTVTARWTPVARLLHRPDGMLMISLVDSVGGTHGVVASLRNQIVRSTRDLYGPRAPLANALIAGWRGELDPDLRSAIASVGLMHLLAISGLHVALLAGWVLLVLRLCRIPRHGAECVAALAALGYTAFLGWPSAALRASFFLLLAAGCRWRQRQVRFDACLGASVLLVLIADPWSVAEPGLWLSIAGLSGVIAGLRWGVHALGTSWWINSVSGSIGAVLMTAPIAAGMFGQVAPIGIALNIVGMPLVATLLPVLFASVLLTPFTHSFAAAFAVSGNGLLALLELLVRIGSKAPGSATPTQVGWTAVWPWIGALLAAVWVAWGRTTLPEAVRRVIWSATAALVLSLVSASRPAFVAGDHGLTLLFLDVGQGDATLIRTPLGHWIEVDAGPVGERYDAGRRMIAPLLARLGVRRIDLFVLSHAHRDHVGGGAGVLERFPVDLALEPGMLFADSAYEDWLSALARHHTRWRRAVAGSQWAIDGVTFRVLHPPSPWPRQGEDLNEDSIVLEVSFGAFRALLTGDAGFVAESAMAGALRTANLLKVGHHGSRTATGAEFLAAIRPQAAIVSVGRNNYGHPSPEALRRLASAGAATWRTDVEGTVSVTTNGRTFDVKGARSIATFETGH